MKHSQSLLSLPYIPYIHKGLINQSATLNIRTQFPGKGIELMRCKDCALHLMVRRHCVLFSDRFPFYFSINHFFCVKTMVIIELIGYGEERKSGNLANHVPIGFVLSFSDLRMIPWYSLVVD